MVVAWLCAKCAPNVNALDSKRTHGLKLAQCLLLHHDLRPLSLYRLQGIPITNRIAVASPEDARIIDDEARKEARLNELDSLPGKTGPQRDISMCIVDLPSIDPVRFVVIEFTPQQGDNLWKYYDGVKGEQKRASTAPYCITNIRQYRDTFYVYIVNNYPKLAPAMGQGIQGIYELSLSDQVFEEWRNFFTKLSVYIFCALLKTSSGYLDGPEDLGTRPINEPGHRLHGMKICPRMLIAQTDPLETIEWLAPAQRDLWNVLLPMLESTEIGNWGPVMAIISALNQMVAFILKDRIRHGRENFRKPFTIPEYVDDAVHALMVLITKFHHMESSAPYTREEALKASPQIYRDIYQRTRVTNYKATRDYGSASWWNGQLFDTNPQWYPVPPVMPGYDWTQDIDSHPTFGDLPYDVSPSDPTSSWRP